MSAFRLGGVGAKHVAVIDIGSASASVGILRIARKGQSMVLAAHRSFIPYEKRTPEQFATRMSAAIAEASSKAMHIYSVRKDRISAIEEAYVFFRPPWTTGEVLKLNKRFEHETRISAGDLQELTKNTVRDKGKILEAIVLRTEVNGYQIEDPIGKTGTSLGVYALVSSITESLQSTIALAVEQSFPQAKPFWRSHMRALLTVLREQESLAKNCVVVDIASEATTCLSIKDGILDRQTTVDFGVHTILEKLSKNSLPEETLGMVRLIERNQCSGEACAQLKASMESLESELVRLYGEKLSQLVPQGRLSQNMMLFVQPDLSPWLARLFSKIDFSQFTIPLQPFTVVELVAKDLQDWVQTESSGADVAYLLTCALVHIEAQRE